MNILNFMIIISGLAGIAGFGVSGYIWKKKKSEEKIVCPAGFNCDTVIYSKYSKFLGIPVEVLGIVYYLTVTLSYILLVLAPQYSSEAFSFFILSLTTLAFIFSIYLTYVQTVLLKQWCTWCLISVGLCTIIFISVWLSSNLDIIQFLNTLINSIPFI